MKNKKEPDKVETTVVKTSLKSIIRDPKSLSIIEDTVDRMNQIVIHTYQFLKAYLCYLTNFNQAFPSKIDKKFIMNIMKTIGTSGITNNKIPDIKLNRFYEKYYKQTLTNNDKVSYASLTQLMNYEATKIVTGIKNHISTNFEVMLNRYINILVNKDQLLEETDDKQNVCYELRKIKNDILYGRSDADSSYDHNPGR